LLLLFGGLLEGLFLLILILFGGLLEGLLLLLLILFGGLLEGLLLLLLFGGLLEGLLLLLLLEGLLVAEVVEVEVIILYIGFISSGSSLTNTSNTRLSNGYDETNLPR